jgi:murein DD-endopeptidase MepM/ murein hydrolase activator NlpD
MRASRIANATVIVLSLAAVAGVGFALRLVEIAVVDVVSVRPASAAPNDGPPDDAAAPPEAEDEETPDPYAFVVDDGTLGAPISYAADRITKKPFGIEIHPETSPVPNDKFDGIHVGVDFEIFEGEEDADVPVFAVCDGPLLFKKQARGYGGVAVQGCLLGGREISVIYGHLDLASVAAGHGERLWRGRRVGFLGDGHSEETDGVRKHLHLGVRDRSVTDIRGYVKDLEGIDAWLNPLDYMDL